MAGMTRLSAPKSSRLTTVAAMPITAAGRFSRFLTCSSNSTTKRAVRAKSSPVVLKVRKLPSTPPRMLLTTQYSQFSRETAKKKVPRSTPSGGSTVEVREKFSSHRVQMQNHRFQPRPLYFSRRDSP